MFESRIDWTTAIMMDSMTLLAIVNKLTGLSLVKSVFIPFLWMGVIFADLEAEWRVPKEKDRLNSADRKEATPDL